MSGRFQPDNGADSAQALADAIALTHEHRFGLVLGPDGRGQIYGDYEGYVRRCGGMGSDGCGEYAPDFVTFQERRKAQQLADAIALIESRGLSVGSVAPACIACSERAEPTSVWCRYHRLRVEEEAAL
jgi:hypothetical protein